MLRVTLGFILFQITFNLLAQSTTPTVRPWSDRFFSQLSLDISDEFDSGSFQLQASLFDAISDIDIFDQDLDDRGSNLKINIKRDVFDNKDITNTYTVADTFQIPASIPIQTGQYISNGQFSFGYNLGVDVSLIFTNIRQVRPKDITEIQNLDEIKKDLKEAQRLAIRIDKDIKEEQQRRSENNEKGIFDFFTSNPRNIAQYSKLLNLISHPLKLPITEKGTQKMSTGAISTYSLDGTVKLGGTIGWSAVDIIGAQVANAGAGVTTYLNGRFKISILKEKDNQMLVKLTRRTARGYQATVGSAEFEYQVFKGFVLSDQRVGEITESIIPFTLQINQENSKQFDVAYRYDLNDDKAKEAYFKAIFGSFKKSSELACEDCSVQRVFTRRMRQSTQTRNYRMKLTILYERGHQTQRSNSRAFITIGDQEHYVFESINTNSRGWDTLWGRDERRDYRFSTSIKDDFFNRNSKKEVALSIEGEIEDSSTSGIEMARYLNEVEYVIGKKVFPPIPLVGPITNCPNLTINEECRPKKPRINFKKSDFYYKVNFSRNQLKKFINFPNEEMWKVLEKAYGIKEGKWGVWSKRLFYLVANSYATFLNLPLALIDFHIDPGGNLISALRFFKRWKRLKKIKSPERLSEKISKLFRSINFNYSILRILKQTINSEVHSFYVKGNADRAFGRVQKSYNYNENRDDLREYIDRVIEFDHLRQRLNYDPSAIIDSFSTKVIDNNNLRIEFEFKIKPKYVFLQINQSSPWKKYKVLLRKIIKNDGAFESGKNTFIINRNDTEGLKGDLAKVIFNNKYNDLKVAISSDSKLWGEVRQTRFRIKDPKTEIRKNENN